MYGAKVMDDILKKSVQLLELERVLKSFPTTP